MLVLFRSRLQVSAFIFFHEGYHDLRAFLIIKSCLSACSASKPLPSVSLMVSVQDSSLLNLRIPLYVSYLLSAFGLHLSSCGQFCFVCQKPELIEWHNCLFFEFHDLLLADATTGACRCYIYFNLLSSRVQHRMYLSQWKRPSACCLPLSVPMRTAGYCLLQLKDLWFDMLEPVVLRSMGFTRAPPIVFDTSVNGVEQKETTSFITSDHTAWMRTIAHSFVRVRWIYLVHRFSEAPAASTTGRSMRLNHRQGSLRRYLTSSSHLKGLANWVFVRSTPSEFLHGQGSFPSEEVAACVWITSWFGEITQKRSFFAFQLINRRERILSVDKSIPALSWI